MQFITSAEWHIGIWHISEWQWIFLVFLDNSNVIYLKKGKLWPLGPRVKIAETLVVFLNFAWVLYMS